MCPVVERGIVLLDGRAKKRREEGMMNYQMHFDPIEHFKQRREEALREAWRRSLAKQAEGYRGMRFELTRVGSALSGV
jgi:hypothetical protein